MGNSANILIVDDDETTRDSLSEIINLLGYTSFMVDDGAKALSHMKENIPNLVLLDIYIPKKDGFEVLQEMKAHKDLKHIPIIAMTAFGKEDDAARCLKMGVDDYLVKPIRRQFLEARISDCLEKRS